MSAQDIKKDVSCRFCLDALDKEPKSAGINKILSDINNIFNLEISENDVWPKRICDTCKQKSKDCVKFFHQIKKGEKKLLKLFGNKFRDKKKDVYSFNEQSCEVQEVIPKDVKMQKKKNLNLTATSSEKPMNLEKKYERDKMNDKKTAQSTSKKQISDQKIFNVLKPKRTRKKITKKKETLKTNNEVVKKYLGFKCEICSEESKSYFALKHHFLNLHGIRGFLICCSTKFTDLGRLSDHVKLHINPETFKCPKCSKVYLNSETYTVHTSACLATPESCKIICEDCSEAFPTQTLLYNHRRKKHVTEEQKRHQCPDCQKRFLTPSNLKYHRLWVHEKIRPFVCDICGFRMPYKAKLEEHIKKTHLKELQPKLKCKHCGKQFIEIHLKDHIRRCNVPSVICSICGNTYKNPNCLKTHIKKVHEGQRGKTYPCLLCPKNFSTKRKLIDHTAKHEGIPLHQCNFCDKRFFSLSTKTAHHRAVHPAENAASKIISQH